jgi:hypothetical protein
LLRHEPLVGFAPIAAAAPLGSRLRERGVVGIQIRWGRAHHGAVVIDAQGEIATLAQHLVRLRRQLGFGEILDERDLNLADEQRVARRDFLFLDDRHPIHRGAVGAVGVVHEHAPADHA